MKFNASLTNLIAEIAHLDDAVEHGLYEEAIWPFYKAIGAVHDACERAMKAAHQVCERENVGCICLIPELEMLDRTIKMLTDRGFLQAEDEEAAEITKAISDAEVAVGKAHDLAEKFAMPEKIDE
jgi:hypothetical protein